MSADVPRTIAKVQRDHVLLRLLPARFLEWGLRRVFSKANEVKQVGAGVSCIVRAAVE